MIVIPIVIFALAVVGIVIWGVNDKKVKDAQKRATQYSMQMQQREKEAATQATSNNIAAQTRSISYDTDYHEHVGDEEERYEKIVGSLGEVDDEGCIDLDGIRLIAHDEAYESETESRNYTEIVKAMVLGEVLDKPAYKRNRK